MIDKNLFLCKAKTVDESKWVYGHYVYRKHELKPKHYIIANIGSVSCKSIIYNMLGTAFEVDSNTICRCTGIKDVEDNLIYEHDICKRYIPDYPIENGNIYWSAKDGSFVWRHYNISTDGYDELYIDEWNELQIIGNEFNDNKEKYYVLL